MQIIHHGGKETVTGSCHELRLGKKGILVDCGLFQGRDSRPMAIDFPLTHLQALLLTHSHIDHVGRIPWLLAAGFYQPIYCTPATAELLPLMLEDGLKLQLGLGQAQRTRILERLNKQIKPVNYGVWQRISRDLDNTYFRFTPAGHILGSAFIEVKLPNNEIVLFSGDLGPSNTPLLPDPVALIIC
ncbi:MBL fold metallo-hydrolase [Vibrio sp. B1-2]|uniref:MBL fold metallo-hydrolase n=1 Tax=Vibrio sp. B1-2 TaxID=2591465 RepID=UPI00403FE9D7